MARIVVCGYMIRHPMAGNVLAYFQYVLGLHRLGHEVLYVEESGWPDSCYDPFANRCSDDPEPGLQTVRNLMARFGVAIPVCYVNRDSGEIRGLDWADAKNMFRQADLLLNIGGVCWLPEFQLIRRLALIDMDPLFTQLGRFGAEAINEHHFHFSYGVNIGRSGCTIPSNGMDWFPTLPPVIPEIWKMGHSVGGLPPTRSEDAPFTTIANWNAYGGINHNGEHYGQKDEEFVRLQALPNYTSQRLELAVSGGDPEIMEGFRSTGWSIRDGGEVSKDVGTYQSYITGSRGEFSASKNAYVKTRSGWFSDRSVCYLAAGLPVILQDTGFSDWLPTGEGILAFSSLEEAANCINEVNARYSAHQRAARQIAEEKFSYEPVLTRLLDHMTV